MGFDPAYRSLQREDSTMRTLLTAFAVSLILCFGGCSGRDSDGTSTDGAPQSTEVVLQELNDALQKWMARSPVPPQNVEQLVASQYYDKAAPSPPPGKRFTINRQEMTIVLVNE